MLTSDEPLNAIDCTFYHVWWYNLTGLFWQCLFPSRIGKFWTKPLINPQLGLLLFHFSKSITWICAYILRLIFFGSSKTEIPRGSCMQIWWNSLIIYFINFGWFECWFIIINIHDTGKRAEQFRSTIKKWK